MRRCGDCGRASREARSEAFRTVKSGAGVLENESGHVAALSSQPSALSPQLALNQLLG